MKINYTKLIKLLILKENEIQNHLKKNNEVWACYLDKKKTISICIKVKKYEDMKGELN